jgi:hypothetical protein
MIGFYCLVGMAHASTTTLAEADFHMGWNPRVNAIGARAIFQ